MALSGPRHRCESGTRNGRAAGVSLDPRSATHLASSQAAAALPRIISGVDSLILYTAEPGMFWRALTEAARGAGGEVSGEPPNLAVMLPETRLYTGETGATDPIPPQLESLGSGVRGIVIDRHNRPVAEAFLADVLALVPGLVDADDDGRVVESASFAKSVKTGQRP
jgi:hypothetical protein